MTNRRQYLIALACVVALPRSALAQKPGRTFRLGYLGNGARTEPYTVAFFERLRELGYVEGRNLAIEFRSSDGRWERLPQLSAELARMKCDVLLAEGTEAVLLALKQATGDTPIVVAAIDYDPLATGHVASLARPGGRITGVTHIQTELPAKRVELLKELLPHAKRFAVLADSASMDQLKVAQAGAKRLDVELQVLEFKRQPYDYDSAFAEATRAKAAALLSLGSGNFVPARRKITDLALKHRLPSMFHTAVWVEFGGLLSYGPSIVSTLRRTAEQVGMIFGGRKPADIPVEQPTTFELAINMKTAKALGITFPQTILVRAERVIE